MFVFSVDLNIVTVVHAIALSEWYNVKYMADLSAQLGQEEKRDQKHFVVAQ